MNLHFACGNAFSALLNILLLTLPLPSSSNNNKQACWEVPQLEELINAGLCVARFNFSHGDHEGHKACLDRLRQAIKNTGKHVGTFVACIMFVAVLVFAAGWYLSSNGRGARYKVYAKCRTDAVRVMGRNLQRRKKMTHHPNASTFSKILRLCLL